MARAESLAMRQHEGIDYADSAIVAAGRGDSATVARLLRDAPRAKPSSLAGSAFGILVLLDEPIVAEPFARALSRVAARQPELSSAMTSMPLVMNLAAQGRRAEADSILSSGPAGTSDPVGVIMGAMLAAAPFLNAPREALQAVRTRVSAFNPDARPAVDPPRLLGAQMRLYLLGLLASRLDEPQEALRRAAELEALPVSAEYRYVPRSLAATVRADVALSAGRATEALEQLKVVRGATPLEFVDGFDPFTEEHARFLRAEALDALGRDDEALSWYENGFSASFSMSFLYHAQAARRLAEMYERRGERAKAIEQYSRFVRMWAQCDPPLRPLVVEARARLARLEGDRTPPVNRVR
jgi:tetratricopeptide (TPR) repeat protein